MIIAILKYLGIGLIRLPAWIIGFIITPFNYWLRHPLRKYFPNITWWFLNDTVQNPAWMDMDWGDYGRFPHTFKGFFKQNAIRNSHWNLILLMAPNNTNLTDVKGKMTFLSIDWGKYEPGFNWGTYKAEGVKYFRISLTLEYLWKFYWHFQLGASDNRYLYKMKWGKIANKRK
jgi:hypothetical protein